ncbi:MAG: DUF4625 domain-containing protein, partial [Bacteroidota bacterium]
MKISFKHLLIWVSLAYAVSCIPIEDTFEPTINDLFVGDTYFLEDTLTAETILTDNFGLEVAYVEIVQIAGETASDWTVSDSVSLRGGRRFEFAYQSVIPQNAAPGLYEITVEVIDAGGNSSFIRRRFNLLGDIRGPIFIEELDLFQDPSRTEIFEIVNGRYRVCRQSILVVEGKAIDNIGIRRITAQLGDFPANTRLIDPPVDTLSLLGAFNGSLIVPIDVPDDTELELVVTVTDTDGNQRSDSIPIIVNCDDEIPIIDSIRFDVNFDGNNTVNLIELDSFQVTSIGLRDNRALENLLVFFNPIGEEVDTLYNIPLNGVPEADSAYVIGQNGGDPIRFILPSVAQFGDVYQAVFVITDTVGNLSEVEVFTIGVDNDAGPRITVAELEVNNTLIESDSTNGTAASPFMVQEFDQIEILGKVEDDRSIENVTVLWGEETAQEGVLNYSPGFTLTTFDFDN